MRPRRTCHAVPGSSERFLAKAPSLEADEVFLDLEDAVAQSEKENARRLVIEALQTRTSATRPSSCASTAPTRRTTTAT